MQQVIKRFLCISGLLLAWQASWAFSLLGPIGNGGPDGDAWQIPIIGYGLPGDVGAPKNIGEEYRRNTAVMFYAYDANFLDYFGSNGVAAVDSALTILNSVFTNNPAGAKIGLDGYSASLSEFPLNSQSINYTAQDLRLLDLKSVALAEMLEQLALAEPERYAWTLHDRHLPAGGTCPLNEEYLVVQRNFDITASPLNQIQYSPYVNGTLYTYAIVETCTGPNPLAVTVPLAQDPFAPTFTAVAGLLDGLNFGGFYTGLTRDDVAGLRYLLTTNNVNWENAASGSLLEFTNFSNNAQQTLYTADLGTLLTTAQTNSPAALATLFPGVIVAGYSNYFTVASNPIVVAYFTNFPGSPVGSPPSLVIYTNGYTYTPVTNYSYSFANLVLTTNWFANSYRTNTTATLMTVTTGTQNGAPVGSPLVTKTNFTSITFPNMPSGDYFLIPPGSCGFNLFSPQPPGFPIQEVTSTTNLLVATINPQGFFYSQSLVTYATNHIFIVNPCTLVSNATGVYQGIEKIQFVNASFDSLIGQYFQPVTNVYFMITVTNSQPQRQTFQRVVTTPDILFSALDLASPNPPVAEIGAALFERSFPNWDQNNILPNLAGPGTINPFGGTNIVISFDKVGDIFGQVGLASANLGTNGFLSQLNQIPLLAWGSFDSSTNDPVVYPNGTSIQNLENMMLIQITLTNVLANTALTSLPNGTNGVPYPTVMFIASGGAFNYSSFNWSALGLPPGLVLAANGTISGTPTGAQPGTYDITLVFTDALGRSVQWTYPIIIQSP
ncbi:MAG: Ig domain-containing protein [Verrucomicrobiia bacterium]